MNLALRGKRLFMLFMAIMLALSCVQLYPRGAVAATVSATLVGDLQTELDNASDWDEKSEVTKMTDMGNGEYRFTGTLPAGTYQYKVALNGAWTESYGVGSYTKPGAVGDGGNIVLTLPEAATVAFYYNDKTHRIADSSYYTPIADDKAPRVVGSLQSELGDSSDWNPGEAGTRLTDPDYDNVYAAKKSVPQGSYAFKILLGSAWEGNQAYPESDKPLVLPQDLDVTFSYNSITNAVAADFVVPADPNGGVPAGFLRIHYNGDASKYSAWLWDDVVAASTGWPNGATAFPSGQTDDYGAFVDVQLKADAKKVGFLLVDKSTEAKDGDNKTVMLTSPAMNEIWVKTGSDIVYPYEPVDPPDNTIRVHYIRDDGKQGDYGLWTWGDVATASSGWPTGAAAFATDTVGRQGSYVDVALAPGAKKINFLVVNRTTGDKDVSADRSFGLLSKYKHIWLKQGDSNVYISPYGDLPIGLVSAEISAPTKVLLGFTTTAGLVADDLKTAIAVKDKNGDPLTVDAAAIKDGTTVELTAALDMEKTPLSVTYAGTTLSARKGWRMLDEMYAYDGNDLGATYDGGDATLKLWAPTASAVVANFYEKDGINSLGQATLAKGAQGVWAAEVSASDLGVSDLKGYYYQYEVTNDGVVKKVLDPYAKSMAEFRVNTKGEAGTDDDAVGKAAIVDLSGTSPSGFGFASIDGYEKREDAIIYETHVRDFTSDPSISGDLTARWGSYKAFIDKLDYIKSLGVTHIQLLPIMAWYFGDESKAGTRESAYSAQDNEYNWGYDPHNYFTPDGAYSEDATDPELRIKETKELVDAIHKAGMGVVLDVVYTHMAKKELLNDIVPGYYAWQDANGSFVGGFGNNLATNHKMAEKLMVDSVKYWFDEYKIDGMRWDMMGDATSDAVQDAYDAAAAINPNALFIGEGWKTFSGNIADPSLEGQGADQGWMNRTDSVGVFSDEMRNELKSGYGSEGQPRFITGGARSISTIFNSIKAQPSNIAQDDPGDVVSYIEAHDNLTLHDVIAQSIKKDPSVAANELEIQKRIRLGNLLILTSQGTAFLQAGQEYGRTKQWKAAGVPEQKYVELKDANDQSFGYFINDSYDSSDAINHFDWAKATDEAAYPAQTETKDYTSGLMKLRRSTDAFTLGDKDLVNANVTLVSAPEIQANDLVIAYKNKATDGTGQYYVFLNADDEERTLTLSEDLTGGTVVVDSDEAGTAAVGTPSGFALTAGSIALDPLTAVVVRVDSAAAQLQSLELDSGSYRLTPGDKHQTKAFAKYDDGTKRNVTDKATYVSDLPSAATVSASGLVTGVDKGAAMISVSYQGKSVSAAVNVVPKRYVKINYIRPDGNYTDWNLWIWGTGVKNDQINFDQVENGVATAMLEVAQEAVSVGVVVRKGADWSTAKQDIPYDRLIPLKPGDPYTKVNITSMVGELDIMPSAIGPQLDDGKATFVYRDDALFKNERMNEISGVKVKIDGELHDMVYDAHKELFGYTLEGLTPHHYAYTFLVTKGGTETEIADPHHAWIEDGHSVLKYAAPTVTISSSMNRNAITSNEEGILTLTTTSSEPVAFREGYIDLTALGGPAKVRFDTALMEQSVSVQDTVTAGSKNVPATLIDEYGNKHGHVAKVNVNARTSAGDALDFDWDEARIYFALTDRFADGDPTNNANVDKSHLEAYHGGDFKGMIDKLDYLKELGINTLWITPIVDNIDFNKGVDWGGKQYGYHGYWAQSFTELDEHLGDLATFKQLIDKAHDKGIKIMVDVVLNHAGYGVKVTDNVAGVTQATRDRFAGLLRTDTVSSDVNPIVGELEHLPDFKTEDPAVRQRIVDWQAGWLDRARTSRGDTIDYFRIDTVKHVEDTTWKAFKNELLRIDPNFKLIGEYFGGTIDNDGGNLYSGQMDGLLDFGFKDKARDFANGSIDSVDAYLADRESKLNNAATMGQFLSSHDEPGFLSEYVGGDEGKLKIAAALQITAKGQPVVYYGEELGRSGAKAADFKEGKFSENRGDMPWDRLTAEQALHDHYMKLLNIRAKYSKVYSKGTRTKIGGSDATGYLAFDKAYAGTNVVTVINVKTASQSVMLNVPFAAGASVKDEYGGGTYTVTSDGKITLDVPGRNDGGTAILAAVVSLPSSSGSGGSSQGDSGAHVVNEEALKNGKEGKVEVAIAGGKHSVLLPIQAAAMLGENDLALRAGELTVAIPREELDAIAKLVSGQDADGAHIQFDFKPVADPIDGKKLIADEEAKGANVRQASPVYEFTLSVVTKDGKSISVTSFKNPLTITLPLTGNPNKELVGIYYIADNGKLEYVGGTVNGDRVSAEVSHFSKYAVLEYEKTFSDVRSGHWAEAVIKALTAKHILNGVNESSFMPQQRINRAEFAAMLVRALGVAADGKTKFDDVDAGKWYAAYVATAAELGIVNGRNGNRFGPNDTMTRQEMAAMIVRALEVKNGKASATGAPAPFEDRGRIGAWALPYVDVAYELGLLKGQGAGMFAPQGVLTRAEAAMAIYSLIKQ
ncbi:pullulanase [Cohnella suwonensis]|uniref:pullulanase n=1 Tax=Cohnella suwonensis TaxID=696072 RepID=A0ABW0LNB2_9BACL